VQENWPRKVKAAAGPSVAAGRRLLLHDVSARLFGVTSAIKPAAKPLRLMVRQ